MSLGFWSSASSRPNNIVGTAKHVVTPCSSIRRAKTSASKRLIDNILQAAWRQPSAPVAQPAVWNSGRNVSRKRKCGLWWLDEALWSFEKATLNGVSCVGETVELLSIHVVHFRLNHFELPTEFLSRIHPFCILYLFSILLNFQEWLPYIKKFCKEFNLRRILSKIRMYS